MSFGADRMSQLSGPVKTPGPIATEASWTRVTTRTNVNPEDNQGDDVAVNGDARGHDALNLSPPAAPPTQPPADGGTDAPGGGGVMTQTMGMRQGRQQLR
jgi:hypothetical protein